MGSAFGVFAACLHVPIRGLHRVFQQRAVVCVHTVKHLVLRECCNLTPFCSDIFALAMGPKAHLHLQM